MYASKMHIYGFKCFGKTVIDFQFPGRKQGELSDIPNVNVILGDNGGGKSSVLRAVAISVLAPILLESGFVAYRLVRRPEADHSFLKIEGVLGKLELKHTERDDPEIELIARIERRANRSLDRLSLKSTPASPFEDLIYDEDSHVFFVAGYGATRRVETGDFSPSSARKMRGRRYGRVAGLFEDQIALRPLEAWFGELSDRRREETIKLINAVLPPYVRFTGRYSDDEGQYVFLFDGRETPFAALSDGYRAFVAWVGDMISHLAEVCPPRANLTSIAGMVLIDEIDLHLHPSWQRTVVNDLARTFPKLQFICTSHSPLIVNSVERQNVFLTGEDDDGAAIIKQLEEHTYGRSVDKLLLSSYFGLNTTRPPSDVQESEAMIQKAMTGDVAAAMSLVRHLSNAAPEGELPAPSSRSKARKVPVKKKAAKRPAKKRS